MYVLLWRLLPGPRAAKVAQCVILAVLAAWALVTWVFPAVEPHIPWSNNTVE